MRAVSRLERMDRLVSETLRRYSEKARADLVRLASSDGHAEVKRVGEFTVTVDCMFDAPGNEHAFRIVASVSRPTLLSSMFPLSKGALVYAA